MGIENVDSPDFHPSSPERKASSHTEAEHAHKLQDGTTDAQVLVEKLVAAGRWPPPDLLRQILNADDAAVEPLRAILRTDLRGWPAQAALVHAIRLVSNLHPPDAIPELVSIIRRYINKVEEEAAEALARFGTPGFEALLDLCRDPSIHGYRRVDVAWAAKSAAGDDPVNRARLAEVLRSILEQLVATAREMNHQQHPVGLADDDEEFLGDDSDDQIDGEDKNLVEEDRPHEDAELDEDWGEDEDFEDDADWDESDDLDEDDLLDSDDDWGDDKDSEEDDNDLTPEVEVEIAFVVSDLADLADPSAADLIKTVFKEGLIDTSFVDEEDVAERYESGEAAPSATTDWLETYRKSYDKHAQELEATVLPPPIDVRRPRYRYEDRYEEGEPPPDTPVTAPILNTGPRLGRNDPCWCGSGKKYKRCHLGKEPPG
jgi:SEC-C motif